MPNKPINKVGLITGASSGIGYALAEVMAEEGYDLILLARRSERLEELKKSIEEKWKRSVLTKVCDVRKLEQMQDTIVSSVQTLGRLDIIVANAGYTISGRFDGLEVQDYRNLFETNFFGMLNTIYPSLPALQESQGTVVIMGSILGELGIMDRSAYVSSKFAQKGFYESVRYELKEKNISLILIEPGFVKTELRYMDKAGERIPVVTDTLKKKTSHSIAVLPDALARDIVRCFGKKGFSRKILTGNAKIFAFLNWISPSLLASVIYKYRDVIRRKIVK